VRSFLERNGQIVKVALIQLNAQTDKAKNIIKATNFVKRAVARGAEFVLLPEVFVYRGKPHGRGGFIQIAEKVPGESTDPLVKLAKKYKVYILAGSIYEKAPGS